MESRSAGLVALLALVVPFGLSGQQWPASSGAVCTNDTRPPGRVVEGEARDLLTLHPLSGVIVTLRSTTARGIRVLGRTRSGPDGAFIFCGVPDDGGLNLNGEAGAVLSRTVQVPEDPDADIPALYLRDSQPADISGIVFDGATGEPVSGALIELEGRPARSITNDEGQFQIAGLGAGRLVLRTSHVAYSPRTDSVDVASADRLDFEIYLYGEVIELAPIVVRARSAAEREGRTVASRTDLLTRVQVDSLLPMVTDMATLIQGARFPGINVRHEAGGGICVTVTRGTRERFPSVGEGCNMLAVYVNGVGVVDPGLELLDINPASVASIQFLDASEARIRYGNARNGVLLITLR